MWRTSVDPVQPRHCGLETVDLVEERKRKEGGMFQKACDIVVRDL